MFNWKFWIVALAVSAYFLVACPEAVLAQEKAAEAAAAHNAPPATLDKGDQAWMLVSCALVLLMTGPGLALFYGGLVRRKNVLGTMMQSFILMGIGPVLWALIGYSLSFGEGSPYIGDLRYLFMNGVGGDP